jgi:hypothetical protein
MKLRNPPYEIIEQKTIPHPMENARWSIGSQTMLSHAKSVRVMEAIQKAMAAGNIPRTTTPIIRGKTVSVVGKANTANTTITQTPAMPFIDQEASRPKARIRRADKEGSCSFSGELSRSAIDIS